MKRSNVRALITKIGGRCMAEFESLRARVAVGGAETQEIQFHKYSKTSFFKA